MVRCRFPDYFAVSLSRGKTARFKSWTRVFFARSCEKIHNYGLPLGGFELRS